MRAFTIVLISFTVIGCTPTPPMIEEPVERERVFNHRFDDVWDGTIDVLARSGNTIIHTEKVSGIIVFERQLDRAELQKYAFVSGFAGSVIGATARATVLIKSLGENSTRVNVNTTFGGTVMGFDQYGRSFTIPQSFRTRGVIERNTLEMIRGSLPGELRYPWLEGASPPQDSKQQEKSPE